MLAIVGMSAAPHVIAWLARAGVLAAPMVFLETHKLLFQFSQPVFGSLGRRAMSDHASDVGFLLSDASFKARERSIRDKNVIVIRSDHEPPLRMERSASAPLTE
jgi:hypothetical protein